MPLSEWGKLKFNLTIMPWNSRWYEHNIKYPYEYANAGYQVVMSTAAHTYFDHPADLRDGASMQENLIRLKKNLLKKP